ncbi:phosphoglycerate dehydrogenase [Geomonas sp. RF6]|uniref:phosphoglycerate dehydrogenase n=1 Tax=Geomonas sp. RF6 TaxID=2897342 RepID=UPI001E568CDF|nr:phosphoglycerate dehydrogenase [Geomonas sp. RF6]UFS68703.1 phosphoglycerate dehydrogenase [Geomonas sp. RF6]
MPSTYKILVLNQISQIGLSRLPIDRYTVAKQISDPDAILVRSADMHSIDIPASVRAIGRAGAGTQNIPTKEMSGRGVPVFNAPGANANAVKELVFAGMLMAARNIPAALKFVEDLDPDDSNMEKTVESGKKNFSGFELSGKTLGIIGLGKIGCIVADAAIKLGMEVIGFDPEITVDSAWSLPSQVKKAESVLDVVRHSNFITVHVPLLDATRHLINASNLEFAQEGTVLLNFAREAVVKEEDVLAALQSKKLHYYVCDFPGAGINGKENVISLPHLGASTREAEENCAVMVADQIRDFLEHGNIQNSVNFPTVLMQRESRFRVAIANSNVPNMVGQISTAMAQHGLNIHNMMNKSRGEMAYTLVDVDSDVPQEVIDSISSIKGVLAVRYLPMAG